MDKNNFISSSLTFPARRPIIRKVLKTGLKNNTDILGGKDYMYNRRRSNAQHY